MLVAWQILAIVVFNRDTVPTPTSILTTMHNDGWSIYWLNIKVTLNEAAKGWLWGNVVAIVLAILFIQVPVPRARPDEVRGRVLLPAGRRHRPGAGGPLRR